MDAQELRNLQEAYLEVVENQLEERTLMKGRKVRPSGTMNMRGSEGAARKDVSRAGFRKKGPIREPEVEKSGKDVPVWVRTHKTPGDYAAHTARKQHREGDKPQSKELKKQFGRTGAKKDSPVHDITVGSPKSKVKDPGQRARQFVGALRGAKDAVKSKKGVATNTPTSIDSAKSKGKKSRSGEEGAEQRGRIYKKLGMGERNPKTGVQMAKLSDSYHRKTFGEFMYECYFVLEGRSREEAEKLRQAKENPNDYSLNNSGSSENPNWRIVSKSNRKGQATARKARIDSLSSPEEKETAKRKEKHIKSRGYEAHHITPTHHSDKIKSSMSDSKWEERKKKDAKVGIYHGHHPKNLMMTRGKNTPANKKGVEHRAGGAHEVEGKVKDIVVGSTITHRDLMAAAVKKQRQKERKERLSKSTN
jgi:hypothetical protein